jgi:hypothetical protein
VSDEQVSAERIPTATFSADPYAMFGADLPQLLTIQDSREPSLPTQPDSTPSTVTITEALRLVRAPLWLLPPDPAIAPPLVEVGNLGNRPLEMWDNVFETALQRRIAIRLTYWLPANGPLTRQTLIYQGDVETFGAYLRTQPAWRGSWQNSEPVRVTIGEHEVDGWRITEAGGTVWTLCEVDGKLLAMQTTYEEQSAALARLQPFGRP